MSTYPSANRMPPVITRTLSEGEMKRVAHMPPMSTRVPTNGSATIAAFAPSRSGTKRKMRPRSPAIRVCPNRCVWLVWMSSGVRTQTLAVRESCDRSISRSALNSPWCMPVIGRSGDRLSSMADGETPTAVDAWTNAASDPHPMPTRNNVQNTLALRGNRERWIPFMACLLNS